MFCGQCNDYYILNMTNGTCTSFSDSPNIVSYYSGSCLKIISENPWAVNISGKVANYLCQKCTNSSLYPSVTGDCVSCTNNTCSSCVESSDYFSSSSNLNYTTLLKYTPLSLLETINSSFAYASYQRCLTCSSSTYGYYSDCQACCVPNLYVSPQITLISRCLECASCLNYQNTLVCGECAACKGYSSSELNIDSKIQSINWASSLYAKKIYYLLKTEGATFSTTPALNDSYTYNNIYSGLTMQAAINFIPSLSYECTFCPIASQSCFYTDLINSTTYEIVYKTGSGNFIEQTSYVLSPYECKSGFVYDQDLKRCKFCPQNWTSCQAYKQINITFASVSNASDPFTVTSFLEFQTLMGQIESDALTYILNEFAVESLEFYLLFPAEFSFSAASLKQSIQTIYSALIPSLSTFSLTFQPLAYESDKSAFSLLDWGIQLTLSGFQKITFQNIIFAVLPATDMSLSPGMILSANVFKMADCMIIPSTNGLSLLSDQIYTSMNSLYNYSYLWKVQTTSNTVEITNLTINISISFDSSTNVKIFQLNGDEKVSISKLNLKGVNFERLTLFSISIAAYISEVQIINSVINDSVVFEIGATKVYCENFLIQNSNFSGIFFIQMTTNLILEINSFFIIRAQLSIPNYFFSAYEISIKKMTISESSIEFLTLFELNSNIQLTEIFLDQNSFIINENSSDIISSFLLYSGGSAVSNVSLINITITSNVATSYNAEARIFYFSLSGIPNVKISNLTFYENPDCSLFYLDTIDIIFGEKVLFLNQGMNYNFHQDGFLVSTVKTKITLENCRFENIETFEGVINVQNWRSDNIVGTIVVKDLYLNNIYYDEQNSFVGSGFFLDSKKTWNIQIINCLFFSSYLNDESAYEGSAVHISVNSITSSLIIQNSTFLNVTSSGKFGSVFGALESIQIYDCFFSYGNFYLGNNVSDSLKMNTKGTFLSLQTTKLILTDSKFSRSYGLIGGAIYIQNSMNRESNFQINRCEFKGIYSLSDGGALYYLKSGDKRSFFLIYNVVFQNIFAIGNGGILMNQALKNSSVSFINCSFVNFDAYEGSIFYQMQSVFTLENCSLSENYDWAIQEGVKSFFLMSSAINFNKTGFAANLFFVSSGSFEMINATIHGIVAEASDSAIMYIQNSFFNCNYSSFLNVSFYYDGIYSVSSNLSFFSTVFYNLSNQLYSISIANLVSYGFLYFSKASQLTCNNCSVSKVYCLQCIYGSFVYSSESTMQVTGSSFEGNYAEKGGVMNVITNENSSITNCSFSNNVVLENGGALMIYQTEFIIKSTIFTNNSAAEGSGGAIYYDSSTSNLWIYDCIFEKNSAYIAGAIYYKNVKIQISATTTFANNSALYYGRNLFSYPSGLMISENSTQFANGSFEISNFRSGDILQNIIVLLFDEEGNRINSSYGLEDASLTVALKKLNSLTELNDKSSINPTSYLITSGGFFNITSLNLVSKPNELVFMYLSSSSIKVGQGLSFYDNYSYFFNVSLRDCTYGEIFESTLGTCEPCSNETFSFNPSDGTCKKCLEGLSCNAAIPTLLPGYWRLETITETIVPCVNNRDACIGGDSSANETCDVGHIGARCESCDLMGLYWKGSFSRSSNKNCLYCDDMPYNYVILVILAVVNFASMALSIFGAIKNIELFLKLKVIKLLSRYNMLRMDNNESSIYIKIYLSYFQVVQIISTFNLTYPTWVQEFFSLFGNPTESSLYSMDCLIKLFNDFMPYLYIKLFIALAVPFLYLLIFSFGYALFISRLKIHRKYSMLYTACMFTLLYFQPTIIQNTIGVLSCLTIGDHDYIKADVAYSCYTNNYWFYSFVIGIPSLMMWGGIVPGIILWRLIKNKNSLNEIRMKTRYGYIYQEYRLFYWEFVKMYEKILITVFIEFYENDVMVKGLLCLIVIIAYLALISCCKPYKTLTLNKMDQISTSVILMSIFLALFSYGNPFFYLVQISYFLIILINLIFNLMIISRIVQSFTPQFDEILQKLPKNKPFTYFIKKPFRTLQKWRVVRRAVAKYLRERERRKMDQDFEDKRLMELSMSDYDPKTTGVKRKKLMRKLSSADSNKISRSRTTKFVTLPDTGDKSVKTEQTKRNNHKDLIFSDTNRSCI